MSKRDNTLVWVVGALLICITIQLVGTLRLKSEIKDLENQIQKLKTHEVHK